MTEIFVFGSNLAGRHGKGAALHARKNWGAIYGVGEGIQGQSYAIPTKDGNLDTLPLVEIEKHVRTFVEYAAAHPEMIFWVTPIGCGLAGYRHDEIAPFFGGDLPNNIHLPEEFRAKVGKPR